MPVYRTSNLAKQLRDNWLSKHPMDSYNTGSINLDDSLTSLNWLQNLKILRVPNPNPLPCNELPRSPVDPVERREQTAETDENGVLRVVHDDGSSGGGGGVGDAASRLRYSHLIYVNNSRGPSKQQTVDYKTNPYVKPPFSYAALICMAMRESPNNKMTLSAIYSWITENFVYYKMADPSWQVSNYLPFFFVFFFFFFFCSLIIKRPGISEGSIRFPCFCLLVGCSKSEVGMFLESSTLCQYLPITP